MKQSILLLTTFLVFQISTFGQQILRTGGTGNSTFLFGNSANARKTQCLYPPSTLTNETNGNIRKLYFKYGSTGTTNDQVLTNLKIRLGLTDDQSISTTQFYTNLETVLDSASYTLPGGPTGTWFSIPIDSTFFYEASRSLIVEVRFTESLIQNWGTYGSDNIPVRKLVSPDVDATTGSGTSFTWQDFGFDLTTVTGNRPQVSYETGVQVFPNPAGESLSFRVQMGNASSGRFVVRNTVGKEVLSGSVNPQQNDVNIRDLAAGTYVLEVQTGEQLYRRKFTRL